MEQSPLVTEITTICERLSKTKWHEGAAGNLSLLLNQSAVSPWLDTSEVSGPKQVLEQTIKELSGKYLLISASGAQMHEICLDPQKHLALLQITEYGESYRVIWGLRDGGKPSSELMVHLLGHAARIAATKDSRAIIHSHPTYAIALSILVRPDNREYSRLLWGIHAEGVNTFPEGVAAIELLPPGGLLLAQKTAKALETHSYVIWERHGVVVSGATLKDCFAKIEVAEKILEIAYITSGSRPHHNILTQKMNDSQICALLTSQGATGRHRYWD